MSYPQELAAPAAYVLAVDDQGEFAWTVIEVPEPGAVALQWAALAVLTGLARRRLERSFP
jgi:hypothetical protein